MVVYETDLLIFFLYTFIYSSTFGVVGLIPASTLCAWSFSLSFGFSHIFEFGYSHI